MPSFLASKTTVLRLLLLLAPALAVDTFRHRGPGGISLLSTLLLAALELNLAACTWKRWRRTRGGVLLIHAGILVIGIGALAGRAGFVATVNIREGGAVQTAYNWAREADAPLGFTLRVKRIHQRYYPAAVKIGIDGPDGRRLLERRTGEEVRLGKWRLRLGALDPKKKALQMVTWGPGGENEHLSAAPRARIGPWELTLVAFQDPPLRDTWVDLEVIDNAGRVASGLCGVNRPFLARGLRFYHTATGTDPQGRAFAGIQIVRDPGRPLVWAGAVLCILGCGMRLITGRKRSRLGP